MDEQKKRLENKLWVMFDRARKERPKDYLLAFAILKEIERLDINHGDNHE